MRFRSLIFCNFFFFSKKFYRFLRIFRLQVYFCMMLYVFFWHATFTYFTDWISCWTRSATTATWVRKLSYSSKPKRKLKPSPDWSGGTVGQQFACTAIKVNRKGITFCPSSDTANRPSWSLQMSLLEV